MDLKFKKYIISIDFGSSVIKYLIMDTSSDDFKIVDKNVSTNHDISYFIDNIIKSYDINENDIEVLIITGARSSFIDNNKYKFRIIRVEEFLALSFGALLLSKQDKAIIINAGTGTTFIYSDLHNTEHLGGTGIGGGTIMSLAKLLYGINNYNDLIDFIKDGNKNNVDLNIDDISSTSIGTLNGKITASNLGAIINDRKKFSNNDVMSGIVNMVVQNIGLLVKEIKNNVETKYRITDISCLLVGGLVSNNYIFDYFKCIGEFTKVNFTLVDNSVHVACIGAYEYYLMKLKYEYDNK